MKTTLELPDELMRAVKIRAAQTDRKLKDVVAQLIELGLRRSPTESADNPLQGLMKKLVFHADGTITNPDGIDDPAFFEELDRIREEGRSEHTRNPIAGFE